MKKILITAFEPFDGRETNASSEVLKSLPEQIGEYTVHKMLLPVVFGKAAGQISAEPFDYIFLLGEAGRNLVTPETTARNIRDARIPDNEGNQPIGETIISGGMETYHTAIPVKKIVEQITGEGYAIEVSEDAGTFVCNDTFYLVGTGTGRPVEFIHVPSAGAAGAANTVCRFIELAVSTGKVLSEV